MKYYQISQTVLDELAKDVRNDSYFGTSPTERISKLEAAIRRFVANIREENGEERVKEKDCK